MARVAENRKGFTLLEILIAIFILGITIAPMVQAFGTAFSSIKTEEDMTVFTNRVRGTLYRVADLDWETLSGNTGYSVDLASLFGSADEANKENFFFRNQSYTPAVAIVDTSGGDGGLLEITVTAGNLSFKTLRSEY